MLATPRARVPLRPGDQRARVFDEAATVPSARAEPTRRPRAANLYLNFGKSDAALARLGSVLKHTRTVCPRG